MLAKLWNEDIPKFITYVFIFTICASVQLLLFSALILTFRGLLAAIKGS